MKRSEAKNLIQTQIAINCGAMKFPLPVDELCDKILQALEDAGMEPPDNNHYNSEYGEWRYWEDESK